MTRFKVGVTAVGLVVGMLFGGPAIAWKRGAVQVLAVVPDVTPGVQSSVEGLTVGPDGNIYVPTFGFNTKGAITGNAALFVFSPNGQLIRNVRIANSSPHMLGLAFNPVTGDLLVLDFGAGNVLKVDPKTGSSSIFMTAPNASSSGLNALTFDKSGNVYVSDSFQGVIWKTGPGGGPPSAWSSGPLLGPDGGLTPPFGANGIEFNNAGTMMYVANTAYHQIIQIPVGAGGAAGPASIFITGINAPDGIMFDRDDNLWVCANQEDEIVVIDTKGKDKGKVIAKLGDFRGIDGKGIARGFLFPASLAFSNDGSWLYVSNLTLYLPYAGAELAIDSPWTLQVSGYTVSRLRAKVPPKDDDDDKQ